MKIGCFLDSDGHFVVVPIENREEIVEVLKTLMDGDYWANELKYLNWNWLITGAEPEHWEDNLRQLPKEGYLK